MFVTEGSNLVDYMSTWVPLTCISRIYVYICDLRSGQCRDLSIISQCRKNENVSRSLFAHRNSPNLLESWGFGTAVMTKVRFLANSLLKGHQRALEATTCKQFYFNNYSLKRDRTLGMASLCLSHQDASTDMQHDLFRSLRDLDQRSDFDLDLSRSNNLSLEVSTRETRWCHCRFFILISSKGIR